MKMMWISIGGNNKSGEEGWIKPDDIKSIKKSKTSSNNVVIEMKDGHIIKYVENFKIGDVSTLKELKKLH